MSDDDILTDAELQTLEIERKVGESARKAYEIFILQYVESRRIQLMQEFIRTPAADPDALCRVKRAMDALADLDNNVRYLINVGEVAELRLQTQEELR